MNFIIEYIYSFFGTNDFNETITNETITNKTITKKRKYDDCINISNIILEKRIKRIPCKYSLFEINAINKRKYDDCIDISNIILEKRIRKISCRYSL